METNVAVWISVAVAPVSSASCERVWPAGPSILPETMMSPPAALNAKLTARHSRNQIRESVLLPRSVGCNYQHGRRGERHEPFYHEVRGPSGRHFVWV